VKVKPLWACGVKESGFNEVALYASSSAFETRDPTKPSQSIT
jgi:hypothetical protein